MADNATISIASGNATIAADDISSVLYQRVKPQHGADGSATDVSTTSPMPVNCYLNASTMQDGTTQLTPLFAVVNVTATGTIVSAVTAKKIRVIAITLTLECQTGDETYTFKSGAAGTALTGALCDAAAAGAVIPVSAFCPVGLFETTAGALLELSLAGTSPNAQGMITYVTV